METEEPASPQEPPSPPPPPSPPAPSTPENPGLPTLEQPSEAHARQLLMEEWKPPGGSLELPPGLTWKLLFLRRPLYRNLLRSPNPEGADGRADSGAPAWVPPPALSSLRLPYPDRPFPCLSISVSVSVSLFLSVSFSVLCLSLSPCVSLLVPGCISVSICLCVLCLYLPCVSLSHPGSLLPSLPLPIF